MHNQWYDISRATLYFDYWFQSTHLAFCSSDITQPNCCVRETVLEIRKFK